jgi:hypothetical protein
MVTVGTQIINKEVVIAAHWVFLDLRRAINSLPAMRAKAEQETERMH